MFRALLVAVAAVVIQGTALADSPIVRDSVGRVAGYYVGGAYGVPALLLVSATGYTFAVTGAGRVSDTHGPADGPLSGVDELFYTAANCEGQPYVRSIGNVSGFVFRSNGSLLYAPKGEVAVERPAVSRKIAGYCFGPTSAIPMLRVLPNDEAVTGVPDADFVPPIQVVIARDVHEVLRDGYESPAT